MAEVIVEHSEELVVDRLWSYIEQAATDAIEKHGVFRIGLSGGSLIKYLASQADKCKTDWTKWKLFFCDERFVDENDEDSTFGQYKKLFVPKTTLSESQFVTVDLSLSLEDAARAYEQEIFKEFGLHDVIYFVLNLNSSYFSPPLHREQFVWPHYRRKPFHNSICCCWAWAQTVTPVHCFPDIVCSKRMMH